MKLRLSVIFTEALGISGVDCYDISMVCKFQLLILLAFLVMPFHVCSASEFNFSVHDYGLPSLSKRLEMIESAKHSIDVEYYIFRADESGALIASALLKKAKEGVRVRLLLDHYANKKPKTFNNFYAHFFAQEGIEIRYFNPTTSIQLIKLNFRNHRKAIIIDGEEVITGGRNIGNEYFDLDLKFNFIDRDVWLKDTVVKDILADFDKIWTSKYVVEARLPFKPRGGRDPSDRRRRQRWEKRYQAAKEFISELGDTFKLRQRVDLLLDQYPQDQWVGHCAQIEYVSDEPKIRAKGGNFVKQDIFKKLAEAQHDVIMETPYFITDKENSLPLLELLDRGVSVDLVTNGLATSDNIYVPTVFHHQVKSWLSKGMKVYVYGGTSVLDHQIGDEDIVWGLHSKTFLFDNETSMIGTFNYDPRSNYLNIEMMITCQNNPDLNLYLRNKIFEHKIRSFGLSKHYNGNWVDHDFDRLSLIQKVIYGIYKYPIRLFTFLL